MLPSLGEDKDRGSLCGVSFNLSDNRTEREGLLYALSKHCPYAPMFQNYFVYPLFHYQACGGVSCFFDRATLVPRSRDDHTASTRFVANR